MKVMTTELTAQSPCPCGSGNAFGQCCQPALTGDKPAATAEALMRSRYTAFQQGLVDYLLATHKPPQPQPDEAAALAKSIQQTQWLNLDVVKTTLGGDADATGTVEFQALYAEADQLGLLHERSNFVRENGQWFYVDGTLFDTPIPTQLLPKRNEPCWCGSGNKYKRCHG